MPEQYEVVGTEVKIQVGTSWYTIADCYAVPRTGDAQENAELIARLLNIHLRKNHERKSI